MGASFGGWLEYFPLSEMADDLPEQDQEKFSRDY